MDGKEVGGGGSLQFFFPAENWLFAFPSVHAHLFISVFTCFASKRSFSHLDYLPLWMIVILSIVFLCLVCWLSSWNEPNVCVCVCVLKLVVHIFFHANLQPVSQECAQDCSREEAVTCQQGQCSSTAVNTCYTCREGTVNNNLKWDMFFSFCIPRANFKISFVSDFNKLSEAFRIVFS